MPAPRNTNYDTTDPDERAAMERKVASDQTPPQWLDRNGRPNPKHPKYKYDPSYEHREFRAQVDASHKAGKMVALPKDRAEQIAANRAAASGISERRIKLTSK